MDVHGSWGFRRCLKVRFSNFQPYQLKNPMDAHSNYGIYGLHHPYTIHICICIYIYIYIFGIIYIHIHTYTSIYDHYGHYGSPHFPQLKTAFEDTLEVSETREAAEIQQRRSEI